LSPNPDGPIWIADGAPSAARWIADRLDVCAATAREWIRVGRALSGLDATVDAFEQGNLTYAKVRVITRIATPDNEAELSKIAQTTPAESIAKALAVWSVANGSGTRRTTSRHSVIVAEVADARTRVPRCVIHDY